MDFNEFIKFFNVAREKEREELAHAQWITHLPYMSLGWMKYVSFDEYFDKLTGKNIDLRPAQTIIEEIENLHGKRRE